MPFDLNAFRVGFIAADANAGRRKVTAVGVGLEAYQIRAQHAVQNFFPSCPKKSTICACIYAERERERTHSAST